ncbi:hypothetical protein BGX34_006441 [Mortierella sp. NVP85]|nr:hypothetical protein BGX34_006441 [Mortierella sp. NVP85]
MSLQSSVPSYENLKGLPLSRPRRCLRLAVPTLPVEDEHENMMGDHAIACTPPLDAETDSSDDPDEFELSLRSPISPSSFPPVPILRHQRKDLQELNSPVLYPSDYNREEEAGHVTAPILANYGKGAQNRGRRPTVTFDLDMDDEPLSPPTKLSARFALDADQRPIGFRHDDEDGNKVNKSDTFDGYSQNIDEDLTGTNAQSSLDIRDKIHQAEQALGRVAITPDVDDNDDDPIDNEAQERAASESSSTQDIILNHVFTGAAPQDMLVALFDRPSELQALAARHSEFFSLMYSSVSKTNRDEFKAVLFKPRESLSDRDWMSAITDYLAPLPPCVLEKFKGIVGWIGPDGDEDEDELWGEDEYGYRDSSFEQVQVKWFRDIENFTLETFQQCYPQFFVNARERLEGRRMSHGGDQRDHFVIFCETLDLTRQDLPCDNAWTRRMNSCLEKHPELLLQLKEIIAYEVEYDN